MAWDEFRSYRRLRRKFLAMHGYPLDLENPQTHSEKIQYRKLFDRRPVYAKLTCKIGARGFVDSVLGQGASDRLMVPILATADRFEDLDLALGQQDIIIKACHGSSWNRVVKAGSQSDWATAKRRAKHWLTRVYGVRRYEWAYQDLEPRLLVEPLLAGPHSDGPLDFKIFCYDGEIQFFMPEDNREAVTKFALYDRNYEKLEMSWEGISISQFAEPVNFAEMKDVARKLSAGFDMLRVDFLLSQDRWYLGEMTLYDGSGMIPFDSYESDKECGRYWRTRTTAT